MSETLGGLLIIEIAAMETRFEKEVCFLRTYAVVTMLFCGGEENFNLCRNRPRKLLIPVMGQFHFMTEPTIIAVGTVIK